MIDRLELFTSAAPSALLSRKLAGKVGEPIGRVRGSELTRLDRASVSSKIVREDEDIRELRLSETNALYRNVLIERILADAKEQESYDDPVTFLVMAFPRYSKQIRDPFKIVCNPSQVSFSRLLAFLRSCFPQRRGEEDHEYLSRFRLGRVDFAHDTPDLSVSQLFQMAHVRRSLRKHTNLYDHNPPGEDGAGFVRTVSGLNLETVYIGKSRYVLRIYDKKREAEHQIQVCKAQGWTVSDHLRDRAALPQLTRIELQIRDLGRSGYVEELDKTTGEIKRTWKPRRGHHYLRSLQDLLTMGPEEMDLFSDVQFRPIEEISPFDREAWKAPAFNALVEKVGFDQALRMLPDGTRQRFREKLRAVAFDRDLDAIQLEQVQNWSRS